MATSFSNLTDSGNLDITAGVHGLVSVTQGISKFAATTSLAASSPVEDFESICWCSWQYPLPGLQQMASLTTSFDQTRAIRAAPDAPAAEALSPLIAGAGIAGPSIQGIQLIKVLPIEWSPATAVRAAKAA
jgi:hypothetical protein